MKVLDERQFEKRSLYIRINVHPLMYGGGNNARCMALPLDMFVAFYRGGIFGLSVRVRERETERETEREREAFSDMLFLRCFHSSLSFAPTLHQQQKRFSSSSTCTKKVSFHYPVFLEPYFLHLSTAHK